MSHTERYISGEIVYRGTEISLRHDRVALEDGRQTGREVIVRPDEVILLAMDSVSCRICRRWRGAMQKESLELPSIPMQEGETPQKAAFRLLEALELKAHALEEIGAFYPSPGILRETVHILMARVESVETEAMGRSALRQAMAQGEIDDMKTTTALALANFQGRLAEERP